MTIGDIINATPAWAVGAVALLAFIYAWRADV